MDGVSTLTSNVCVPFSWISSQVLHLLSCCKALPYLVMFGKSSAFPMVPVVVMI